MSRMPFIDWRNGTKVDEARFVKGLRKAQKLWSRVKQVHERSGGRSMRGELRMRAELSARSVHSASKKSLNPLVPITNRTYDINIYINI